MKNLHLVAHTHWDREWYRPFQYFRTKLVYVIDRLIDILENDSAFNSFLLDGQTIVLDDYLAVKPENRHRLEKLIRTGRLIIGPWYVQPDEFAPDAESLVRNLLLGIRQAESFGRSMMVGYLPDSFGHSCQMPQILRGFGIDSAVMMRGVDFDRIGSTEFSWVGLNGDKVLGLYLIKGYMNAMFLSKDNEINRHRLEGLAAELSEYCLCDRVLVMNGVDHAFAQPQTAGLCSGSEGFEMGSLEEYTSLAAAQTEGRLPELHGELLTPRHHRVHSSIASSRISQKGFNRRLSLQLERGCEPLCTAAMLAGAEYPAGLLREAWRKLISNQTHDGICGCCTDEVHREIDQRFIETEQIIRTLFNSHGRALSASAFAGGSGLLVFNSAMRAGEHLVEAEVFSAGPFRLIDEQGCGCDYQILSIEETDLSRLSIWTLYMGKSRPSYRHRIMFRCGFDSVLGYRLFRIEPVPDAAVPEPAAGTETEGTETQSFNNDYYSLKIESDGSLTLTERGSGRLFKGLCVFEDCGEGGDSYNHSPLEGDSPVLSSGTKAEVTRLSDGPFYTRFQILHRLKVPRSLSADGKRRSDDTAELPVRLQLGCSRFSRRIDCSVEIENRVLSHRIRVLFPFTGEVEHSFAETQFGTVCRSIDAPAGGADWPEVPLPIYPMQRFAGVSDGTCSLTVLNRGLTEYEVYRREQPVLAVTLHRGVSMMGKPDLAVRPGRASGIEIPSPDAEEQGLLRREFALVFGGSADYAWAAAEADFYTAPPAAFQSRLELNEPSGEEGSFFRSISIDNLQSVIGDCLSPEGVTGSSLLKISTDRLSVSAVKKGEDNNSVIIRLYNPGKSPVNDAVLQVGFRHSGAESTDLNERRGKALSAVDGGFLLPVIRMAEQITIRILREE